MMSKRARFAFVNLGKAGLLSIVIVSVLSACNTPGGGPCTLFLAPSSINIVQGKSATFNATVNSSCTVTGAATMSIENPTNFPFYISFVKAGDLNATGTITANLNATLNSYAVTVVATASGQSIKGLLNVAVVSR